MSLSLIDDLAKVAGNPQEQARLIAAASDSNAASEAGVIVQSITPADTTHAPSGDALATALALKLAIAKVFVSTEQTGTGSSQSVAHGLGATPTKVLIAVTNYSGTGAFVVTEGSHTSTNVVVTVTSGVKFKVLAI